MEIEKMIRTNQTQQWLYTTVNATSAHFPKHSGIEVFLFVHYVTDKPVTLDNPYLGLHMQLNIYKSLEWSPSPHRRFKVSSQCKGEVCPLFQCIQVYLCEFCFKHCIFALGGCWFLSVSCRSAEMARMSVFRFSALALLLLSACCWADNEVGHSQDPLYHSVDVTACLQTFK